MQNGFNYQKENGILHFPKRSKIFCKTGLVHQLLLNSEFRASEYV